jgi:hypothetical protein
VLLKNHPANSNLFSGHERTGVVILFTALWVYLFLRAINVPLLHDELATFFYYVQSDVYLPPNAHWDANNHVLNSMLANWSYHIFGQSPLALRLPNVLAFPLYFWSAYGIASRLKSGFLRWGLLTALVMSTYIFEYQAECRGYGLSLALLLTALYFVMRLLETNSHFNVLFIGVFLFMSTLANLTLLISSVLIFFLVFVHALWTDRKNISCLIFKIIWLLITGLPFLLLVKLSLRLKELGLLYYGSKAGFTGITLPSLLQQFFGSAHPFLMGINFGFAILILVILGITLFKRQKISDGFILFSYLLFGAVACIFLLAHFLDVNYPEDRTAMYLYIYFVPAFVFALDVAGYRFRWMQFVGIFAFAVPVLFLFHISLRGSVFSSEERHSQKTFDLINEKPSDFKFPATVGGYITQELCWYYLSNCAGGNQGRLHWTNHPGLDADFQLVSTSFRFNPQTYTYYDSIYRDEATGLVLFERKNKLPRKLISVLDIPDTQDNPTGYYNLGKYVLDTLRNKILFVGAEMTLESAEIPFNARLVAGVDNAAGENIVYEHISLHWLRRQYAGAQNKVLQGTLIHDVPDDAVSMTFYLWNINEKPFSIRDGKCYLYSLERDFSE